MHKRILALICAAMLMSNLVPVENWSMITRAEEQEEQTEEETESVEEAEPEEITGTVEEAEQEKVTETVEEAVEEKETETVEETVVETKEVSKASVHADDTGEPVTPEFNAPELSETEIVLNVSSGTDSEKELTATPDERDGIASWESSDATVVSVTSDADDNSKAVVKAVNAGSATVTVTTQGGKTAECKVKVTKDVDSIIIEQPAETEFYPAFTDSVQFTAVLTPDEEYCNDPTITWSVNEGGTASIDPSTGELTLHELKDDEETVTVTAKAGNKKGSLEIVLKKAEITEISVDDIDVTYGKEAQLAATVKSGDETVSEDKMPSLHFEETEGAVTAEVTADGKVIPLKTGVFKVKVSTDGNSYFKSAESPEKELTVQPAKLQVKVTEGSAEAPIVTKVSDGTTALTTDNITAIENAFSLEGIVDGDEVSLKVGDDASWSSLSYEENKLGSNIVSLNSLKDSFELEGTDSVNYVLDAVNALKVTAEITPKAPETSDYDMTQAKEDQTLALTDDEVSGILLSAGTKGTDGAYWYNEAGLPLTVVEGYQLLTDQYVQYTDSFITETSKTYYVKQTKEDNTVWYYGPYTIELQCDGAEPTYQIDEIKKINFGKESTEFTIIIKDTDGSGVDADSIRYFIGDSKTMKEDGTLPAETDSAWKKSATVSQDGENYKVTVTVPASGYLYIQAADKVANNSFGGPFYLLILENTAPTVTVTCQDQDYDFDAPRNTHTLNITAEDAEEDGTEPYPYSGIQSLTYSLSRQNEDGTAGDTVLTAEDAEASMPLTMDAVKAARTKIKDQIVLRNDDQGQPLNGNYILTVTAVDFCGNETVKSDWILNFDNETPKLVDASYYGYTHIGTDGNVYYGQNATAHQMQLSILEKNFDPNLDNDSSIVVKKNGQQITEGYTVTWEHDGELHKAIVDLTGIDGTEENDIYTVESLYQDPAGNQLEKSDTCELRKNESLSEGKFTGTAMVIDKVSPVVTRIVTSENLNGEPDGSPYDGTDYYINKTITTVITIEDENLPSDSTEIWKTSMKKDGNDVEADLRTAESGQITFTMEADGRYSELKATGTDLAGNPLVLAENGYEHEMWDEAEAENGTVSLSYARVVDTIAPTAVITYSSKADPNGYDTEYYYNKDITAEIAVTDKYGDISCGIDLTKLFTVCRKDGQGTAENISSEKTVYKIDKEDGRYDLSIYGTDRAGNALTVREQTPGTTDVFEETVSCKDDYTAQYTIIRDTTAPVFTFQVTPDASVTNQKKQDDGRYYFNGDYRVTVVVEDTNFDSEKVFLDKGMTVAGAYDASAAAISDYKKLTGDTYNHGNNIYTDSESMEGVFRYAVYGTDKAGNALVMKKGSGINEDLEGTCDTKDLEGTKASQEENARTWEETTADTSCYIIVDKTKPTGTLTVGNGKETYYQIQVQDGAVDQAEPYRTEKEAYIQITSDDFSPVQIAYTTDRLENDEVKEAAETKGNGFSYQQNRESTVSGEQIFRISGISITDRAGNEISLAKTNKIYLDVTPPTMDELAPTISVVATSESDERGTKGTPLFKNDVPLHIKVTDPYGGSKSSGLSEVTYHLYINGSEVAGDRQVLNPESTTKWNGNYEDSSLIFDIDRTITVNASSHNYNDIRVVVNAKDNAGNTNTRNYTFGIDVTAPTIEVEYDNNDAQNGRYFKADRVATVTVTERNFSSDLIDISTQSSNISSWSYSKGSDANGDDDKWTAEITYNVDGEYTLDISGEDLLGQSAGSTSYSGTAPQDFVIDKTAPVLTLEFDRNDPANGKYYNSARTAILSVDDVNFDGQADITVNASGGGAAPAFTFIGKSSSATFNVDGIYSFAGTVTDMAGNVSLPVECEEFVIDQTAPVITFHDVEDMTAYGKSDSAFAPYITIDDTNFDPAGVTVTMSRMKWDSEEEMTDFGGLNGSTWQLKELEQIPENDAVYTLNVRVQDMAGNPNSDADSVTFSLNRYGSVYVLGEETSALLEQYYTNEAQELTLTEYNLSNQADSWIDVSRNSEEEKQLTKNTDYSVQQQGDPGNDCNWKQTEYQIHASNFAEDGTYKVLVYSKDTLENATTNENPAAEEYASVIEFCKDTEGPTVTLTGVEEGGFYNEASMPLLVNYFDNNEMERLNIQVVNAADENDVIDSVEYLADDGTIDAASGKLEYTLKENAKVQKVIVTATDRAGNTSEPQSITFTMSTSAWVRFYNNKPLFYGTIAGVAGAAALILIFIIWKKRSSKDKETKE